MKCEECKFGAWWSANIRECENEKSTHHRSLLWLKAGCDIGQPKEKS